MRLGDTDVRIGPHAELAAHHEREDPRLVGLERERQQVEHQRDVVLERLRHADRRARHVELAVARCSRPAGCAARSRARWSRYSSSRVRSRRPTCRVRSAQILGDDVEHAAVARACAPAADPSCSPSRTCRSNTTRGLISIGSGLRRRLPAERVHVGAAVAGSCRRRAAPLKSSVATSSDGNIVSWPICCAIDLVDARAGRGSRCRPCASAERRSATTPVHGVVLSQLLRPREVADDGQRIAERLERLQDRRQLEAGAADAGVHWFRITPCGT